VSFLPKDDTLSADEELEAAFWDDDPDVVFETELPTRKAFGRTWQFDFGTRRMVRQGSRPAQIDGLNNLRQWIETVLYVAADAHPIFPDDYGMSDPDIMIGKEYSPALQQDFQDQVVDALLYHDKIKAVDNFVFEYDDENVVTYTFIVHTDEEEPLEIANTYGVPDGT
jgi:hypothetical protein